MDSGFLVSSILLFWMLGVLVCFPGFLKRRVFWELSMLTLKALYSNLPLPICGKEIKCRKEPFCVKGFGTDAFLARPRRKMFLARSVAREMVMGIHFWSVLFLPSSMFGNCLSSLHLCPWIAASGLDVCFGMGGCLVLVVLVAAILGLLLLEA